MPFEATTPLTQTGLDLDVRYLNPENRDEKPPAITKVVIRLPEGTRIDTSAAPVCEATNEELQARGRDACPPASQVGQGKLEAYTGAPNDPVRADLTLFNGPGQIIELVLFEGTNATAGIDRLTIEGDVLRGAPPSVPGGPPDGRTAVSRITWDLPARGGYLVTPPSCAGAWRTVGEFGFNDGGEAVVESVQACDAAPAAVPPPAPISSEVRVRARPRRIVRGRPARIRVRLLSADPACLRGATVRVGRRSATTGRAGRARMRILVRSNKRPSVRVDTSCGRTFTRLYALPW